MNTYIVVAGGDVLLRPRVLIDAETEHKLGVYGLDWVEVRAHSRTEARQLAVFEE